MALVLVLGLGSGRGLGLVLGLVLGFFLGLVMIMVLDSRSPIANALTPLPPVLLPPVDCLQARPGGLEAPGDHPGQATAGPERPRINSHTFHKPLCKAPPAVRLLNARRFLAQELQQSQAAGSAGGAGAEEHAVPRGPRIGAAGLDGSA